MGIYEILVVIGYQKEQFVKWSAAYPQIKLIENPYYKNCNNISSLYMARDYLEDAIIRDGDQMIYNPEVLNPFFERSGYQALWTEQRTDEWLLTMENGIITHCSRNGGRRGWRLFSISRWSAEDGRKLKQHLRTEFAVKKTIKSTGTM